MRYDAVIFESSSVKLREAFLHPERFLEVQSLVQTILQRLALTSVCGVWTIRLLHVTYQLLLSHEVLQCRVSLETMRLRRMFPLWLVAMFFPFISWYLLAFSFSFVMASALNSYPFWILKTDFINEVFMLKKIIIIFV